MINERILCLQSELNDGEAALIISDINRLYYTGFPSSAGYLAVTQDSAELLVDFRYYEAAASKVKCCRVTLFGRLYEQLGKIFSAKHVKTVFLETEYVSISKLADLRDKLPGIEISDDGRVQQLILRQRSVKSKEEIACIKAAQRITDDAFGYILGKIRPGISEKQIALDMEFFMRREGSEGTAFDFIAVSGKNSSLPHGVPTDKLIEKGDFVTMDYGAVCGGYRSDMTRTVAVGSVCERQKEVYETVLRAQEAAFEQIRPGAVCRDVDAAARSLIADAGYGGCFGHGLGHSVGLEIHESPACNTLCETPLEPGMIMTVEPGIYIENEFGVRIEDMAVVTKDGFIDITQSKKELIIL